MSVSSSQVSPKIEAGALAEYLVAKPRRRERILLDQRMPQLGPPYYRAADETICGFLLGIPKQERLIESKISVLTSLHALARGKETRIAHNIDALEAFLDHPHREFLEEIETFPGPRRGSLEVAGVEIAVCPEIIALDPDTSSFGFIKLRFARRPLAPEEAAHLVAILRAYAQSCATHAHGALNLDLTCVVDVLDGTLLRASSITSIDRTARLHIACEEIAAHWPLIFPRNAFSLPTRRNLR